MKKLQILVLALALSGCQIQGWQIRQAQEKCAHRDEIIHHITGASLVCSDGYLEKFERVDLRVAKEE